MSFGQRGDALDTRQLAALGFDLSATSSSSARAGIALAHGLGRLDNPTRAAFDAKGSPIGGSSE